MSRSTGAHNPAAPPAASTSHPGEKTKLQPVGTCMPGVGVFSPCIAKTSSLKDATWSSIRCAFLLIGRRCFTRSLLLRALARSLIDLPVPYDIQRRRHHEIGFAYQRFAQPVLLVLGRTHHPHIAVVVAALLTLRIRTIERGREQPRAAQRTDKFLVVVIEPLIKLLDRPGNFHRSEFDVVGSVGLVVGAPIVGYRLKLLVAFLALRSAA